MVLQDFLFLSSIIVNTIVSLLETDCTRNSASWLNYFSFNYSSRYNPVVCKTQHVHDCLPYAKACTITSKNFRYRPVTKVLISYLRLSVYVDVSFLTY